MKNYTNKYSEERMYIMSERELKEERIKAVKRYKELKKRKMKRIAAKIMQEVAYGIFVSIAFLAVVTMFICAIPPR